MLQLALRDGYVDLERAVVVRGGSVALSPIEQRLIQYLAQRPGVLVSREDLLGEVWGYRAGVQSRTIDSTLRRIRRKIEIDPANPTHLVAVYGRGVMWAPSPPAPRGSRFVGRVAEREALGALLRASRLAVIIGPAGAGKTRLAEEVVPGLPFPQVWARLRGSATGDELHRAVAEALGAPPGTSEPSGLSRALAARGPLLLVLDGAEAAAGPLRALVPAWLAAAPDLRVLATSRREIDLDAQRLALGPLSPADGRELFSARVPSSVTAAPDEVDALVAALQGLPVWIELAAARARVCGPAELVRLLDHRLDLLAGDEDAARSLVDGSLALLAPSERAALDALAAFEGPFTLEDAAAVLGVAWALDAVQALVDHSLIAPERGPTLTRFSLFDVVRERVRELGAPPPEAASRHAARHARWASRAFEDALLPELVAAEPDLRAALHRCAESAPEDAGRCAAELLVVYHRSGPLSGALALTDPVRRLACSAPLRATLLLGLAESHRLAGKIDSALSLATEALAGAPEASTARLRCLRSELLAKRGDWAGAREELARAAQASPSPDARAQVAFVAARLARGEGALDEAMERFAEARALAPQRRSLVAACLAAEAELCRASADAALRFTEALSAVGADERARAMVLVSYAAFLCDEGDLDAASARLTEAEACCAALADPVASASASALGALLAVRQGAPDAAARALGRLGVEPATLPSQAVAALAEARLCCGDRSGAQHLLAKARADSPTARLCALEVLAASTAERKDRLPSAIAFHDRASRPSHSAVFAAMRAAAAAEDGQLEEAHALLAQARSLAEEARAAPRSAAAFWIARAQDGFAARRPE